MKKNLKNGLLAIAGSGLVIASLATVSAQQNNINTNEIQTIQSKMRHGDSGKSGQGKFMGGMSQRGGLGMLGDITEGSTISATFYDGNPAEGAAELSSYTLNVGIDSESSFAQNIQEAMQTAAFAVINTSAQSRTIELNSDDTQTRAFKRLPMRGLTEGSTLEISFYDGNPEEAATVLGSLSFTAGVDSELAFSNAVEDASANAAYAVITTSAQERSIDLSVMQERMQERGGEGFRHFGPRGQGNLGVPSEDLETGPNS